MLNEPTASSFHISIPIPIHGSIHRATWLPPPPPYQSVSLHDCHVVHEAFLAFGVWLSSASAPAAVSASVQPCLSLVVPLRGPSPVLCPIDLTSGLSLERHTCTSRSTTTTPPESRGSKSPHAYGCASECWNCR